MKGSETKILDYMEGAKNRYVIPVYQRKYSWKEENCRQLFSDLEKVATQNLPSHFFGSVVTAISGNGAIIDHHIIDGQQRVTTVTLLLIAIVNLVRQGKVKLRDADLADNIYETYLHSKWLKEIKLWPVEGDRIALDKLFGDEGDFVPASQLTLNYKFFCNAILGSKVSVDELFGAISRLEIISITLGEGDNAQLIFESLNSTGLALSEGDKIRNFILMGIPSKQQASFYKNFWLKIEECTKDNVSAFVRDFLSIKQQATPRMDRVYPEFKAFVATDAFGMEPLLQDLLDYARLYERLLACQSRFEDKKVRVQMDNCLFRLERLEITATRPFLLEVLSMVQGGKLTEADALKIFLIVESFIFRRYICEIPSNGLNKLFVSLNREILRYDGTAADYVQKFIYALRSKTGSVRFPDDEEFRRDLELKQVYLLRARYRDYILERFENFGTKATVDVFRKLDENELSVEHIMPQTLTDWWREHLGPDAEIIHQEWCHRLANLTLTAYNSELSNKPFYEKRDAPKFGYKASALKLNMKIVEKDAWGERDLEERNDELLDRATTIWELPATEFELVAKELDSSTLDDEDFEYKGKNLAKYSYAGEEQLVKSWTDMFERVVKLLHSQDGSVLSDLAYGNAAEPIAKFFSSSEAFGKDSLKLGEHVYFDKNMNTSKKLAILRRLFDLYGADKADLMFYLKTGKDEEDEGDLRKEYWSFALPKIREHNAVLGTFDKVNAIPSAWINGHFGIGGFAVACYALSTGARIQIEFCKGDAAKNKAAFDKLFPHKTEIEEELGVELVWNRNDGQKSSSIGYALPDVNFTSEADWPRMAEFHAAWSEKLLQTVLPYLKRQENGEASEAEKRLSQIAELLREWAARREDINANLEKSNRKYTRFTTAAMTSILPDLQEPSSWNTTNHYFYEIKNATGDSVYISFVLNSQNITDEFRRLCDRVEELYPSKNGKPDWKWRTHFVTSKLTFGKILVKEDIFAGLDSLLEEVKQFEKDLAGKLALLPSTV